MAADDEDEEQGCGDKKAPLWLLTFTDIMALMLTFFVLLYSMAVPKQDDWVKFTSGMTTGFSKYKSPKSFSGEQQEINIDRIDYKKALSLDYLESIVLDLISKNKILRGVRVLNQGDKLILSLPTDVVFKKGQARLQPRGQRVLKVIGGPLSRMRNRIEIIGHTDPDPMRGGEISSNWALSLLRAAEVSGVLRQAGYMRSFMLRGMSSARFDELPDDMPRGERLDYARRVDIVILKDDGRQRLILE